LKKFKIDLLRKREYYNYVPVTLDELMVRFIHNIQRNEYIK